jgi:uncharacterized protein
VKPALLLAPGAGADSSSPALVAVERAVDERFEVRRMDFPYRKEGRKAPDRAPKLVQAVRDEAAQLDSTGGLFLGGRSMGGRMCSMAVAEGLPAAGLVLISYPLHPPGKPDKLRVEHFAAIEIPCLFVSGTRDAFATPDELEKHTAAIPGEVTHVWVEGADHGMRKFDDVVAEHVRAWLWAQRGG